MQAMPSVSIPAKLSCDTCIIAGYAGDSGRGFEIHINFFFFFF